MLLHGGTPQLFKIIIDLFHYVNNFRSKVTDSLLQECFNSIMVAVMVRLFAHALQMQGRRQLQLFAFVALQGGNESAQITAGVLFSQGLTSGIDSVTPHGEFGRSRGTNGWIGRQIARLEDSLEATACAE